MIETFLQGYEELGYALVSEFLRNMVPDLIDLGEADSM